jgi:hypothetical protein
MPTDEQKAYAKLLYTRHDNTPLEAALAANVSEADVRDWIRTDSWNDIKRSLLTSRTSQLEMMYIALESTTGKIKAGEMPLKEMDNMVKVTAAIKNLNTELSIATIIEVAEMFTSWLLKKDIAFAKSVTKQLDMFIRQRIVADNNRF